MAKICITPRSLSSPPHHYLHKLEEAGFSLVFPAPGRQPSEEELLQTVPECVGWLAGVEPISGRVLEASPKLRVISRNGTGVDNIDLAAAQKLGIKVLKAEGANSRGAAELTFALILAGVRHIVEAANSLKRREWKREMGYELYGKTLGLIGLGRVGRMVAEIALGFGMQVLVFTRTRDEEYACSKGLRYVELDELLSKSDIISLHIPALPGGPLLDAKAFAMMKKGVVIVNTARASLIDSQAALAALARGQVSCLTLDAYSKEPPEEWELVTHPRVIATPHIGAYTKESVDRATQVAVDNLLAFLGKA